MMPEDGQYCINKDTKELVRFIGNLNGDYSCDLGVVEDVEGNIKIVRLTDIQKVCKEEAEIHDPYTYILLSVQDNCCENYE